MPQISVVIPAYNCAGTIKRAIDSVYAQTVAPYEVIVVDDGSTDGSPEVVSALSYKDLHLIRLEHGGAGHARNAGFSVVRGQLVALLDADDEWFPRHLEVATGLLDNYPTAGAAATAFRYKYDSGRFSHPVCDFRLTGSSHGIVDYLDPSMQPPINCSNSVVRRSALRDVGWMSEREMRGEDVAFWFRFSLRFEAAFSKEMCVLIHTDRRDRISDTIFLSERASIIDDIDEALAAPGDEKKKAKLRRFRERWCFDLARQNVISGRRRTARKWLTQISERRIAGFYLWYLLSWAPIAIVKWLLSVKRSIS